MLGLFLNSKEEIVTGAGKVRQRVVEAKFRVSREEAKSETIQVNIPEMEQQQENE